jgi:predicted ArsR family transcriptional regulator
MDKRKFQGQSDNERLREALKVGPQTPRQVAERLGMDYLRVRAALSNMVTRGYGVASEGTKGAKTYFLCNKKKEEKVSTHIAPRITIGRGLRWFGGY